jgi:hypothetical protein
MSQIPSLNGVLQASAMVRQAQQQKERRQRRQPQQAKPEGTPAEETTPTSSEIAPAPSDGLDHLDLKA